MALDGTLESFAIGEILQLVSHQGKTGTLGIRTSDGEARLRFQQGKLLEAWPDERSPTELIGARLVSAGLVSERQLEQALRTQRQTLRPLGGILIQAGALRVAEFQEVLALQHRETVYQLLRLKKGRFRFLPETVEVEEGVSVPMEVDALLMEGSRQIDEWPKVLERVPSGNRVFVLGETLAEEELTEDEARVLSLVDGVSTVREVVARARLGEFGGWETLAGLRDKGAIVPADVIRRLPLKGRHRSASSRRPLLDPLLAAACALSAAILGLSWLLAGPGQVTRFQHALREAAREARELGERQSAWASERPAAWPVAPGDGRPRDEERALR